MLKKHVDNIFWLIESLKNHLFETEMSSLSLNKYVFNKMFSIQKNVHITCFVLFPNKLIWAKDVSTVTIVWKKHFLTDFPMFLQAAERRPHSIPSTPTWRSFTASFCRAHRSTSTWSALSGTWSTASTGSCTPQYSWFYCEYDPRVW